VTFAEDGPREATAFDDGLLVTEIPATESLRATRADGKFEAGSVRSRSFAADAPIRRAELAGRCPYTVRLGLSRNA
jgi:hypothetical protein